MSPKSFLKGMYISALLILSLLAVSYLAIETAIYIQSITTEQVRNVIGAIVGWLMMSFVVGVIVEGCN